MFCSAKPSGRNSDFGPVHTQELSYICEKQVRTSPAWQPRLEEVEHSLSLDDGQGPSVLPALLHGRSLKPQPSRVQGLAREFGLCAKVMW